MIPASHPILTCAAARSLEEGLFAGDEAKEWPAMQQAGRAIARAVLADFEEIGGFPAAGRILVLVGKGHNGGDALIAAAEILRRFPAAQVELHFVFGERALRPLAARARRELSAATTISAPEAAYDLCLDGIFGFQFRAPAEPRVAALIDQVNTLPIRVRAAVDLPSAGLFRADFTYATGSVKTPVLDTPNTGRLRYLDLGFFRGDEPGENRVLTPGVLAGLAALRPAASDKRTYGHVFILAGSLPYPGAALMAVLAALRSGVGLVTAFVPESLVPAYAVRAPEAMWVGWPETSAGSLALEGWHLLHEKLGRATALVIGPGLGREAETQALVIQILKNITIPVVLDADALQPDLVRAGKTPRILTPHAGEFARIAGGQTPGALATELNATVVLKGPVTRVYDGTTVGHSFFGGPVLSRGGSGDLLAGLTGGLLAQTPGDPALAAARGVVWHGRAADLLARAHGAVAVNTTQLLDYLPAALRVVES
ncbi:MAG: NAD(P)H-hydrate dehydratase [Verrucomicrobia bacterium]|nr:NAD(P)H-hydrate dehydratase [Verrucomicrobiota bacterium]